MTLTDTHCHIHAEYPLPADEVLKRARQAGVDRMICVGTSEADSEAAVSFARQHPHIFAAVGVHPHETSAGYGRIADILSDPAGIVAVGEIGLDYFYTHSPRESQLKALRFQLDLAVRHDLPVIFHVREAFEDFWPVLDDFPGLRGVIHSFTDDDRNLDIALGRGLYIGVNGISTFTKEDAQKARYDRVPLDNLLFETDAPFLTPTPYRGKVNEPAYIRVIAAYHAARREISETEIARRTTANAARLFTLS